MNSGHPSAQTEQHNTYRNAFGVINVIEGVGRHAIGMDEEAPVKIIHGPGKVPDRSKGPKLVVMRVFYETTDRDDEVIGVLNYDSKKVQKVIDDLRSNLEKLMDEYVVADIESSIRYYTGNSEYPNERSHSGVYFFQQQMNDKRGVFQLVSRLGTGKRSGIPIFAKKSIPLPQEDDNGVWAMCSVFVREHGNIAVAVAESDKDRVIAAIRSLERQVQAIRQMNSLPAPTGEANRIARQLKSITRFD